MTSRHRLQRLLLSLAIWAVAVISAARSIPQASRNGRNEKSSDAKPGRGVEIVQHGGYPELHVDGTPFFIHSAAFFYIRVPRDQWETMLERYRSVGINTIDIYIPWNWHEPKDGELDFDGHTNPRRDLRSLLAIVAQKGFRLIARPGPEILNEWRHGGYPGWLLEQPEYNMNPVDWSEGRYPPLDGLNSHDAEAAARGWLENPTHLANTRAWFAAVGKELAPYSSHRTVRKPADDPEGPPREASGPLLFVQLGDDLAIGRANRAGPEFWRYMNLLRGWLDAAGLDVPVYINPTDMRVSAAGSGLERPIGVMGQWYLSRLSGAEPSERSLTAHDLSEIEFFTEELKTQPDFPPVIIEYQAGWYAPGDDDRPLENRPENTLLSSRLLIGNGIHGINYFPLQDTFTPAGYSVPWANRSYRWDAALGPDGDQQPRLRAVHRNARVLERWGPALAASHKRADFGIIYPLGAYPQEELRPPDIFRVSECVMRIERLGALAMLSSELLDPEYQPIEQLLRNPVIFLPTFNPEKSQFLLSNRAQSEIVEYIRRGGTLVVFPERPVGNILEELWKSAPAPAEPSADTAIRAQWKFGQGEIIESSKDFFSWLALDRSLTENRTQRESNWAMGVLRGFLSAAGVRSSVKITGKLTQAGEIIASELVTNEGTGLLGERTAGQGFLSVTNLSDDEPADTFLDVLSPSASAKGAHVDHRPVHIIVPASESLLLPLDAPICFADKVNAPCGDAVAAAGAEFLDAQREGKTLSLLFYVPARAEINLHFEQEPSHITLEETKSDASWDPSTKELQVVIPRGAAPNFLRVLKVELPYKPRVPEKEKPGKLTPNQFEYFVANAIRLPTSQNAFLRTYPPLVLLDLDHPTNVLVEGKNRNTQMPRDANITIDGDLHGNGSIHIAPHGDSIEKIRLRVPEKDAAQLPHPADGFLHGTMEVKSGKDDRRAPIVFLRPRRSGTTPYCYDFDRDGADEWVLENASLRLIVSPESGGRAIAFVDKNAGASLTTSVGLIRDNFSYAENPPWSNEIRARGRFGLSNRPYFAEWLSENTNPALKMHYEAADVFPAGATIEKTIQFEDAKTLRVDYRVALRAPAAGAGAPLNQPQSFVAVNSFPAATVGEHPTRFCWRNLAAAQKETASGTSGGTEETDHHCEDFSPGGKVIEIPVGETRVEVRMPARPAVAIEWDCTRICPRMKIEQKSFSGLLRLEFPPLEPGAAAAEYTLRIRVLGLP